jgi:hypothetical protein
LLPPWHLKCQVGYILKPNGIHNFAKHKRGAPKEHWKLMWGRIPATTKHLHAVMDHQ